MSSLGIRARMLAFAHVAWRCSLVYRFSFQRNIIDMDLDRLLSGSSSLLAWQRKTLLSFR